MPHRTLWTRRHALGALGAAATVPFVRAGRAADTRTGRHIINVHAHYQPPAIRALNLPGPMNAWDLHKQVDDMGCRGVDARSSAGRTPAPGHR